MALGLMLLNSTFNPPYSRSESFAYVSRCLRTGVHQLAAHVPERRGVLRAHAKGAHALLPSQLPFVLVAIFCTL